jgi:PilZ domain
MTRVPFSSLDMKYVCTTGWGVQGKMKERRAAHRYELILPVTIEASVENKPSSYSGKTLDISTCGVYFVLDNDFEVGTRLGLTMKLPTGSTDRTQAFIRVVGQVVRVEKRPETGGVNIAVAAAIKRYGYVRDEIPDNSAQWLSALVRSFAR